MDVSGHVHGSGVYARVARARVRKCAGSSVHVHGSGRCGREGETARGNFMEAVHVHGSGACAREWGRAWKFHGRPCTCMVRGVLARMYGWVWCMELGRVGAGLTMSRK
jgi:hypothetical protein